MKDLRLKVALKYGILSIIPIPFLFFGLAHLEFNKKNNRYISFTDAVVIGLIIITISWILTNIIVNIFHTPGFLIFASSIYYLLIEIDLLFILITFEALWKIFKKAGKPGWAALIPFYNYVVLLEIVKKPVWWIVLLFIPIVNIFIAIYVINLLSKSFGKTSSFTVGLILLPFIYFPKLGLSKIKFIGEPREREIVQETESTPSRQSKRDAAKDMYVNNLIRQDIIANKFNCSIETVNEWIKQGNWDELKINKNKDRLVNYLIGNINKSNKDSFIAFKSIFMDLEVTPEFTDKEMLAGLKYIALHHEDPILRGFAIKIMNEGGKSIKDIDIEIFESQKPKMPSLNNTQVKLLNFLDAGITKSNNDSFKAFKSIFMDLEVEPEFTDNQMMAGLKYLSLNDPDENKRLFAEQIVKEGNKSMVDIDLNNFHNL